MSRGFIRALQSLSKLRWGYVSFNFLMNWDLKIFLLGISQVSRVRVASFSWTARNVGQQNERGRGLVIQGFAWCVYLFDVWASACTRGSERPAGTEASRRFGPYPRRHRRGCGSCTCILFSSAKQNRCSAREVSASRHSARSCTIGTCDDCYCCTGAR